MGKIRNTAATIATSSITVDVRDYSYYCSYVKSGIEVVNWN